MYKYKLKEGCEGRVFINTVKHDDGTITSQVQLNSPYLEEVQSTSPAPNHVTGVAPPSQQPSQPIQAVSPQNEQITNKVEEQ